MRSWYIRLLAFRLDFFKREEVKKLGISMPRVIFFSRLLFGSSNSPTLNVFGMCGAGAERSFRFEMPHGE